MRRARLPSWIEFFLTFDVEYRRRRLHFLIEGQNRLYRLSTKGRFPGLDPAVVDRLKREFYLRLDVLATARRAEVFQLPRPFAGGETVPQLPTTAEARDLRHPCASQFVASDNVETSISWLEALGQEIDLNSTTRDLDELLASLDPPRGIRKHVARFW